VLPASNVISYMYQINAVKFRHIQFKTTIFANLKKTSYFINSIFFALL